MEYLVDGDPVIIRLKRSIINKVLKVPGLIYVEMACGSFHFTV